MELLVLHSAGASEEQDRLHGAGELRGTDDKGTCPHGAALPTATCLPWGNVWEPGTGQRRTGLKRSFWKMFNNVGGALDCS